MKSTKAIQQDTAHRNERRLAIELVHDLFDVAQEEGVSDTGIAEAALFQSVMKLVGAYGEDAVARSLEKTVIGVRGGYYTMADAAH